jgi:hypothetical protein
MQGRDALRVAPILVFLGPFLSLPARSAPAAALLVRVENRTGTAPAVLSRAENDAARLFKKAGIALHWVNCPPAKLERLPAPSCGPAPASIRLVLLPGSVVSNQLQSPDVIGQALPTAVLVFADRIHSRAQWVASSESDMLGAIIVHELGHALLGAGHSASGVMLANLESSEFRAYAAGRLCFSRQQALSMQANLKSGQTFSALAGPSEAEQTDLGGPGRDRLAMNRSHQPE